MRRTIAYALLAFSLPIVGVVGYGIGAKHGMKSAKPAPDVSAVASGPHSSHAAPAPETGNYSKAARIALDALYDLDGLVHAGITYQEYQERLGDARVVVSRFLRAHPTDLTPPSRKHIEASMWIYEHAGRMWEKKIECAAEGWADLAREFEGLARDAWAEAGKRLPEIQSALSTS